MAAKLIRRLCSDFATVEAGECSREQGIAYRRWIEQFAVSAAELPARPAEFGPHFSAEGIDIFMAGTSPTTQSTAIPSCRTPRILTCPEQGHRISHPH